MSRFPDASELLDAYRDQIEALTRLWQARRIVIADTQSRFYGLSERQLEYRLERDRHELDRATMMMVLASFEAMLRWDAIDRIKTRTKDVVRDTLRKQGEDANTVRLMPLVDLLGVWEQHASARRKDTVRSLLKHRHWLAHGRYWVDKSAIKLTPHDAQAVLDEYADALRELCPDFPRR